MTIIFQDDFIGSNGDPPDIAKWTESDGYNLLSIQDNKLDFNAVNQENLAAGIITSIQEVSGEFSCTVDWEVLSYTPNALESLGWIRINFIGGDWVFIQRMHDGFLDAVYGVASSQDSLQQISTIHTSGKFKIERDASNNTRVWCWSGAQWEWDGDTEGYLTGLSNSDGGNIIIGSQVNCDSKYLGNYHVTFDNLLASGTSGEEEEAISTAIDRLTINLNLKRNALTQWTNFDFNSMAMFNGVPIAANEDGIFSLFDSDDDNGTNIDAFFELVKTDLGTSETKKIRFYYFTGETSGDLKIKLQVDDGEERTFLVPAKKIGQLQHRLHRVDGRNDLRGVYWRPRIENTKGCDFSVDAIDILLSLLGNR